jgi:hypothetical protein
MSAEQMSPEETKIRQAIHDLNAILTDKFGEGSCVIGHNHPINDRIFVYVTRRGIVKQVRQYDEFGGFPVESRYTGPFKIGS